MESFGAFIRKLRLEKGLPLRTVASYLEMDQAILSKIERGQRRASREHVVKLAGYLNVDITNFLIAWLSDKLVEEVKDEKVALEALKVAEERIAYLTFTKIGREETIKAIKDYLKQDGRIRKAWLFGSFARGEDDYKSDIDLMIEVPAESSFSLFDLADIRYHLEAKIPRKVDVVMKGGVKPHVMERMKPDLTVIYER